MTEKQIRIPLEVHNLLKNYKVKTKVPYIHIVSQAIIEYIKNHQKD